MRSLSGKHPGEEMIVVGNGPSLSNVAGPFLRSRPTIAMNWLPRYRDDFEPTYWVCQDDICQRATEFLPEATVRFMPYHLLVRKKWPAHRFRPNTDWTTTAMLAAEMALVMGAKTILVVGFDCSHRDAPYMNRGEGVTAQPHFYNVHPDAEKHEKWNEEAKILQRIVEGAGSQVFNLSDPTFCDTLQRENASDWYSSTG